MIAVDIIAALDLPDSALVKKRVSKKLLLDNGAATAADRRRITEDVEELMWLAALKPTSVGVKEYKDDTREYLEIDVLHLSLRSDSKSARLIELVHRAIPYPILLLTQQPGATELSAAHKRWAHNDSGKVVLSGDMVATRWNAGQADEYWSDFRDALSLGRQPRSTLFALYQGWIDTLLAVQAARLTNIWHRSVDHEHASARQKALFEYARLETEIGRIRTAASKEQQMARRIDLNSELKRIQMELVMVRDRI